MRHRVDKKKLNRDMDHRKGLLRTLTTQLLENEFVITTTAKAKYLRPRVEKVITRAKDMNTDNKIDIFNTVKILKNKVNTEKALDKLTTELAKRFEARKGGYTRIVKVKTRSGDGAELSRIEIVKE